MPHFLLPRLGRRAKQRRRTIDRACHPRVETLETRVLLSVFEYPTTAGGHPIGIAPGPDGNIWYTEQDINRIGVMGTDGTPIAEYRVPTANSRPEFLTAGPDGNVWFTEQRASKIGVITPDGSITEFSTPSPNSAPTFITAGPDGNLWYSEYYTGRIGRISPDGTQTEFELPTPNSHPMGLTVGPDGNIWFTEFTGNQVGYITPDGQTIQEFPLDLGGTQPINITAGPDGNLWFAEYNYPSSQIARIAPDGTGLTEFTLPSPVSDVEAISPGPDGNLWFTDSRGNKVDAITPDGTVQEYATPTIGSGPLGITLGPDGTDLWFAEIDSNRIGQIVFDGGGFTPRPGSDPRLGVDLAPPATMRPSVHRIFGDEMPWPRNLSRAPIANEATNSASAQVADHREAAIAAIAAPPVLDQAFEHFALEEILPQYSPRSAR